MPRNKNTQDVDVETVDAEVEEVEQSAEETKPAKAKAEPKRGTLPEGFVTPVGLAKVLGEKGLQKNRQGEVLSEVKPQMVYSYMKNAPESDPFPLQEVEDSLGHTRKVVNLEEGIAWWERKNTRTDTRKANAAEKKAAAEKRAAEKAAQGETTEAEAEAGEVTEAE